ncbi:MAG TPA: hypothetical protein VIL77_05455 [Gaiellaceae bacterium]
MPAREQPLYGTSHFRVLIGKRELGFAEVGPLSSGTDLGAIPRAERASTSGAHARGIRDGSLVAASSAEKNEVGERDVELREEARIGEDQACEPLLHPRRHGEVETCEAGDAVAGRERRDGRLHAGHDLGDG